MDDFGQNHDAELRELINVECAMMQQKATAAAPTVDVTTREKSRQLPATMIGKIPPGRKQIFDNIDYEQKVHHMTEEHQNTLTHWTSYMTTENRISPGNVNMPYTFIGYILQNRFPMISLNLQQKCWLCLDLLLQKE